MKKIKLFTILSLLAVVGFGIIACGDPGGGNGTTGGTTNGDCEHIFSTIPATCIANSIPGICTQDGCNEPNTEVLVQALGHDHFESLTCKRTGCDHQYELGDTGPAGGIIFYRDTNGFKLYQGTNNDVALDTYITAYYFEAWTSNEEGTYIWSWTNEPTPFPNSQYIVVPLVQQAIDILNTTQWIGYGLRNTKLIISAMNAMTSPNNQDSIQANRAVHVASTTKGGFNDWFLPSVDELYAMYIARAAPNNIAGLPTTGGFWSSSESLSNDEARVRYFNDGTRNSYYKPPSVASVRAVRAF